MSKAVKEMMTQELTSFFEDMGDCLVVNYQGLPVPETDEVRAELRQAGLKMKMVNNAMAGRALERVGLADVSKLLDGPSAFLVGGDGPVEAAKAFTDLMKKRPALQLRGAWVEGALLGGFVLALAERLTVRYAPIASSFAEAVPLILLIAFLVFRPTGLLKPRV